MTSMIDDFFGNKNTFRFGKVMSNKTSNNTYIKAKPISDTIYD